MLVYLASMWIAAIILIVLGLQIWKKHKINLVMHHHVHDVKDVKGYCNEIGKLLTILGVFHFLLGGAGLIPNLPEYFLIGVHFAGYIVILLLIRKVQKKYTGRGFFM